MVEPSQQRERFAGETDNDRSEQLPDLKTDTPPSVELYDDGRWGGFELVFLAPVALVLAWGFIMLVSGFGSVFGVLLGYAAVVAAAIRLATRTRGWLAGLALYVSFFLCLYPLVIGGWFLLMKATMRSG